MTNYERIQNWVKLPAEWGLFDLAEWLCDSMNDCKQCPMFDTCSIPCGWANWLEQEVEE